MSRIGNQPVTVPPGVTVTATDTVVMVKGPRGEVLIPIIGLLTVSQSGNIVTISRSDENRQTRSTHGAFRAELANGIIGVTTGWSKTLELVGVGYRAAVNGTSLVLTVGFSHSVTVEPPKGISFAIDEGKVIVSGINRHTVGQVAADIRAVKPPEPYKGKGIKYVGEYIRKKAGKAKAVGSTSGAK